MSELAPRNDIELYWEKALASGAERLILGRARSENRLFGRLCEYLGYAMLSEMYPPPTYILTKPRETALMRRSMTQDEIERWQPRSPDGLLLQNLEPGVVRLVGIVEYKAPNILHFEELQAQLDGFARFIRFLGLHDGNRGKSILKRHVSGNIKQLEVPGNAQFIYVVPKGRTAEGIATTLYEVDNFRELALPFDRSEIMKRAKEERRRVRLARRATRKY